VAVGGEPGQIASTTRKGGDEEMTLVILVAVVALTIGAIVHIARKPWPWWGKALAMLAAVVVGAYLFALRIILKDSSRR
jgi:hypothetical protein